MFLETMHEAGVMSHATSHFSSAQTTFQHRFIPLLHLPQPVLCDMNCLYRLKCIELRSVSADFIATYTGSVSLLAFNATP